MDNIPNDRVPKAIWQHFSTTGKIGSYLFYSALAKTSQKDGDKG